MSLMLDFHLGARDSREGSHNQESHGRRGGGSSGGGRKSYGPPPGEALRMGRIRYYTDELGGPHWIALNTTNPDKLTRYTFPISDEDDLKDGLEELHGDPSWTWKDYLTGVYDPDTSTFYPEKLPKGDHIGDMDAFIKGKLRTALGNEVRIDEGELPEVDPEPKGPRRDTSEELDESGFKAGRPVRLTPFSSHEVPGLDRSKPHRSQMPAKSVKARDQLIEDQNPLFGHRENLRGSVDAYTGGWAYENNPRLRKGERYLGGIDARILESLDNGFDDATPTKSDLTVFRSTQFPKGSGLKEGDSFTDKGFTSTSLDPGIAQLARAVHGYPQTALIKVPKGSKALFTAAYRDTGDNEVILPRNGNYEVEWVDPKGDRIVLVFKGVSDELDAAAKLVKRKSMDPKGKKALARFGDWNMDDLDIHRKSDLSEPAMLDYYLGENNGD